MSVKQKQYLAAVVSPELEGVLGTCGFPISKWSLPWPWGTKVLKISLKYLLT